MKIIGNRMKNIITLVTATALCAFCIEGSTAFTLGNHGLIRNQVEDIPGLMQTISIFPEDNRGPLSIRGHQEGLTQHDIQKAKENIAKLTCPGTTYKNGGSDEAILIGSEDQIVTNAHSFIDEKGRPRDPLSQCFVQFIAHDGPDTAKKYFLALKDGQIGMEQSVSQGILRIGDKKVHNADDYAAVKLVERVPGVKAYQLGLLPYLHGCDVGDPVCQQMVMISAISPRTRTKIAGNELIIQSCSIRGIGTLIHRTGKVFYSNCSAPDGSSSSIAFLKDDDGQLARGKDGELMPIAILSESSLDRYDGRKYDGVDVWTSSIGLNGAVKDAIEEVTDKK